MGAPPPQNPVPGLGDAEPPPHLIQHMRSSPLLPPAGLHTPLSPPNYDYPQLKREVSEAGSGLVQMGSMQGIPPDPHGHPDTWREYDQAYDDWDYPKDLPRPMPPFNPHNAPYQHPGPPFEREAMWGHGGPGTAPGSIHSQDPGPLRMISTFTMFGLGKSLLQVGV